MAGKSLYTPAQKNSVKRMIMEQMIENMNRLYIIEEDNLIHLNSTGNNKRILFMDPEGGCISLVMNKETFDYLRNKMIRFNASTNQKERQKFLRQQKSKELPLEESNYNGTQKDKNK